MIKYGCHIASFSLVKDQEYAFIAQRCLHALGAAIFSSRRKVLNRMNLLLNQFVTEDNKHFFHKDTDIRAWCQGGEILLLPFVKCVPLNMEQTSGHNIIIRDADKMQVPKPCTLWLWFHCQRWVGVVVENVYLFKDPWGILRQVLWGSFTGLGCNMQPSLGLDMMIQWGVTELGMRKSGGQTCH